MIDHQRRPGAMMHDGTKNPEHFYVIGHGANARYAVNRATRGQPTRLTIRSRTEGIRGYFGINETGNRWRNVATIEKQPKRMAALAVKGMKNE